MSIASASGNGVGPAVVRRAQPLQDLVLLVIAKCAVSAAVVGSGFRAISDDDYARVVISQQFALSPSLDPSKTSWLPFPFWVQGSLIALGPAGEGLRVARTLAWALGCMACLLVYFAARIWGIPRSGALCAGLISAVFPYAAWTGVATVPDGTTASLMLFGCAALVAGSSRISQGLGVAALLAASWSRYEAWPWLAACSLWSLGRAIRQRKWGSVLLALSPLLGPLAWMLNGVVQHHDPWFFVTRVASYQRALGVDGGSAGVRALGVAVRWFRFEPEIALSTLLAAGVLVRARIRPFPYGPLLVSWVSLLLFLMLGELGAAGPTHHGERAVLVGWLAGAVLVGAVWAHPWSPGVRWTALVLWAGCLSGVACIVRPRITRLESFSNRSEEVAMGYAARDQAKSGTLLVDTADYGFFAVIAAFGDPRRAVPVNLRDPRQPRPADPFASRPALVAFLQHSSARWLVSYDQRAVLAAELGIVRYRAGRWALVELPTGNAMARMPSAPRGDGKFPAVPPKD